MRFSGITMSIAGWLWADLLLGAFVIFAVANTVGPAATTLPIPATGPSTQAAATPTPIPTALAAIDAVALELAIPIDGAALLSSDPRTMASEQQRIADVAARAAGSRRVALVMAFGTHQDAATGDRLALLATGALRSGPFERAAIKTFHNLVTGDRGSSVLLSVYFYQ